MVLSVPFYNILGFLYLNNSPSHFSYFLYNLLNLACFTLTVILWMVQGVASRRNSYILACISCKLVRGQYMSSQKKKMKITGQVLVKDTASLPGKSRKQQLYMRQNLSVYSGVGHTDNHLTIPLCSHVCMQVCFTL